MRLGHFTVRNRLPNSFQSGSVEFRNQIDLTTARRVPARDGGQLE